ncbi:MAG TPA: DUF4421 domain-containing protein [Puia sp.]|nr:DUF4421 domain-containing protein [Puia sp.]
MMTKNITAIPIFLLLHISLSAQTIKKSDHDTTYYFSYRDQITGRIYLSRKYTVLKLTPPTGDISKMTYRANTTLNVGIGATYRSLTLNIGVGINSFNPNQEKGTTHYLDLQTHWYLRKWNFDFLGEFYRGYYLTPKGLGSPDGSSYYLRNDLAVNLGGVAVYRALNDKKFSYQAGLVQSEWQKKSAGSFLIGGEIYYGAIYGDSVLVPSLVDPAYQQLGIDKVHCFEIGPGIGYGYTLVFAEHYFLLASATINIDFRYTREIESNYDHYIDKADITPNFIFHAGLGYNSNRWSLSLLWVGDQIHIRGGASDYKYLFTTGNYRLIFAKRFAVNRKVKKALKPINDLIENN